MANSPYKTSYGSWTPVEEKTGSNLSLIIKSKGHFGYFKYSISDFLEIPFYEGTRFNRRCSVHIAHSELTKVIWFESWTLV